MTAPGGNVETMLGDSSSMAPFKPEATSRVGTGRRLLPTIKGTTVWARIMRDVMRALIAHMGGENYITEPQRLMARRAACFEAELIHLEDLIARQRQAGEQPSDRALDLYGRLSAHQRRALEAIGLTRVARPIELDPLTYAARYEASEVESE
jgi:hypothetical protein